MIRISRLVTSSRVLDILKLEGVSKIEVKRNDQKGFIRPISRVLIYLCPDKVLFNGCLGNLNHCVISSGDHTLRAIVSNARMNGFIKESAFKKCNCPIPSKYNYYCVKYSQEFFNKFGKEEG